MQAARQRRVRFRDAVRLQDRSSLRPLVDRLRARRRSRHARARGVHGDSPTFESALQPLELAAAALVEGYGRAGFMGQVHTDAAVRDAGNDAEERINKWRVALVFRDDLYRAVRAFADTDEAKALEGERARLLVHWLRDFRRAGTS